MSNIHKYHSSISDNSIIIPDNWKLYKWKDLILSYEQGLIRSNLQLVNNGVFYFKMHNISSNGTCDYSKREFTTTTLEELEHYTLKNGDFLINVRNSYDLVGKTCVVSSLTEPTVYNHMLIKIKHVDERLNYYINALLSKTYWKQYVDGCKKGTTTVIALYKEDIENIPIPVPPENTFNFIVNFEKKILASIDNNLSICSDLESMAKLIYDYWFIQFDFPDANGRPYKSSGGKMVWSKDLKREIPEGWEVTKLKNIFETERGISYNTANIETGKGIPMLNLATFRPGGGEYKSEGLKHFLGDCPKSKLLKPYDLIMCNTQQTSIKFETDIIGRAMLVPDIFENEITFSHHVNVIRTKNDDMKFFLLYLFNSDYFHKYIAGFTNGTNILGLSFNGVEDFITAIPSNELLSKFAKIIQPVFEKKSCIFKENQDLDSLRDFLLPMLMNGQVKVKS